ncbi:MAG: AAA family ATPase [Salinivirgaceae bacterium]|nr:AAA family ATPase [Salinivirgaceae bacterium]
MAIERIDKIKNHRIFSGFAWPQDLLDFKEKNLFYGWNGSGKSTLSNLLRSIEKQAPISEGQVEFVIDGNKVDGANLTTAQGLPQVRVFNKDKCSINPIYSNPKIYEIEFISGNTFLLMY